MLPQLFVVTSLYLMAKHNEYAEAIDGMRCYKDPSSLVLEENVDSFLPIFKSAGHNDTEQVSNDWTMLP